MTIALFDLDYTLLEGDSERLWSEFLAEQGVVDHKFVNQIVGYYKDYEIGRLDIQAYETFLLQPILSLSLLELTLLCTRYLRAIRIRLRPFMLERLAWHRTQGHILVLITATNSLLAEAIVSLLDIPYLISTGIEIENGRPTGKLAGIPAYREGKVQRLETWLEENHQSLAGSWGYSDSHNDLPLLQRVTRPVAVKPDSILRAYALEQGWMVMD